MKFKDIDSVKKKTMSCLPKGCLSLNSRKKNKGIKNGMTEEEVKEEYINAYEVSGVSSVPNGTLKNDESNGIETSEKTFEPSYHVYRSVSFLFLFFSLFCIFRLTNFACIDLATNTRTWTCLASIIALVRIVCLSVCLTSYAMICCMFCCEHTGLSVCPRMH